MKRDGGRRVGEGREGDGGCDENIQAVWMGPAWGEGFFLWHDGCSLRPPSTPLMSPHQSERSEGAEDAICAAVIAYLREHPDAQDTARGVVEWWLPGMGQRRGIRETERALERLVREGWIDAWSAADGRRHYRLRAGRQAGGPGGGVSR